MGHPAGHRWLGWANHADEHFELWDTAGAIASDPEGSPPFSVDDLGVLRALRDALIAIGDQSTVELDDHDVVRQICTLVDERRIVIVRSPLLRAQTDAPGAIVDLHDLAEPTDELARIAPPVDHESGESTTAPKQPAELGWFEVRILDDVGLPVDDIDVAFSSSGIERCVTTDSDGRARIELPSGALVCARVASLPAARSRMKPVWERPRVVEPYSEQGAIAIALRDPLPTLAIAPATTKT